MKRLNRWIYAVIGVIVLLLAGLIYAWSVLVIPIANEFTNWSHTSLSLTFTICMTLFCIGGLIGGILQKIIDADVLVLASPVYFYSIDAQLKAVIDRTVARWLEVKNKEFYYIMTAAEEDKSSMDTTLACFRGYADCVNGAKEMGVIYGTGVYEKGKVLNTPAMAEAYEMGKNV